MKTPADALFIIALLASVSRLVELLAGKIRRILFIAMWLAIGHIAALIIVGLLIARAMQ